MMKCFPGIPNSSLNDGRKFFRKYLPWSSFFYLLYSLAFVVFLSHFCSLAFAESHTVSFDGNSRSYLLRKPEIIKPNKLYPVVLALHGGGGMAEGMERMSGLTATAKKYNFIVVYPEGSTPAKNKGRYRTWNAGVCCGFAKEQNVDDISFFSALIDDLIQYHQADPRRIYVTGISNGAMMAYRLACELSEKITAIAPVAISHSFLPCSPTRAVPVIHIHGTADSCARYKGGLCGGCFENFTRRLFFFSSKEPELWPCNSVEKTIDDWRKRNTCSLETDIFYKQGSALCEKYRNCKDNSEVSFCIIQDGGHTWPGGENPIQVCGRNPNRRICRLYNESVGPTSADLDTNEIIWAFFREKLL